MGSTMNNTSTLNEGHYSHHSSNHNKNDINAYKRVPLLRSTRCLLNISGCSGMYTSEWCGGEASPELQNDTLLLECMFVHWSTPIYN